MYILCTTPVSDYPSLSLNYGLAAFSLQGRGEGKKKSDRSRQKRLDPYDESLLFGDAGWDVIAQCKYTP